MGYKRTITGSYNQGTIVEATITETADIAQLLESGTMIMIDKSDLEKARAGKSIHALFHNLQTGQITGNKHYQISESIDDSLWVETEFKRTWDTEFDYS